MSLPTGGGDPAKWESWVRGFFGAGQVRPGDSRLKRTALDFASVRDMNARRYTEHGGNEREALTRPGGSGHRRRATRREGNCPRPGPCGSARRGELQPVAPGGASYGARDRRSGRAGRGAPGRCLPASAGPGDVSHTGEAVRPSGRAGEQRRGVFSSRLERTDGEGLGRVWDKFVGWH